MSFTVEQKSQLAKLMATENITVQHSKINTAYFDVKNRVLMLPIWQDMTGALYDLLTGHEVGHALYTPAEGWHDVVMEKSKGKNYKSFVNVVEDARIEKKIKRKYPGLLSPFRLAYESLFKKDFFGINNRDVNKMPFIDRLNIYTKSQYTHNIQFSEDEFQMVEKVRECETWEDVLRVVDEIYDYSKEEQSQLQEMSMPSYGDEGSDDENEGSEFSDDFDEESENESGDGSDDEEGDDLDSAEDESEESGETSEDGEESDTDSEDESEESGTKTNRYKDSGPESEPVEEPSCETDENFRKNEQLLLDEKSKEYQYVTLPKPILENIVVGYKDVQNNLSNFYKSDLNMNRSQKLVSDFKNKNDRYISLLAKEFEMRKSAKVYAKGKISETGDIDINKLSSYKFDDNIFRKMMVIPKGKSHGLILLLDCSGSMMHNMHGSIEQILVLASFCRKVNIPFEVYGFNDNANPKFGGRDRHGLFQDIYFKYKPNDVALMGNIQLRNYLSSKMSNVEFSKALRNMLILREAFATRYYGIPPEENLCATPLIQAVVACGAIMKDFRQKNNLDITNLVIVHDGDADNCAYVYKNEETATLGTLGTIDWYDKNVYLVDKDIKFQEKFGPDGEKYYRDYYGSNSLGAYLKWFKKYTQSNVFGFYIVNGGGYYLRNALSDKYVYENGDTFNEANANVEHEQKKQNMNVLTTQLRKNKFVSSKNAGYKQFYFILGGKSLAIDNDEIEIDGKVTSSKLKNAFMEMNRKKVVNRVLVSKFIQNMAVE